MSFEVDFHAVGADSSSSGDAITIRYGALDTPAQRVVVIDGGYRSDGQALAQFIKTTYGAKRVDLVVNTHPHEDHVSGLQVILEELQVDKLWMHRPWNHSRAINLFITDGRVTTASLTERIQRSLAQARDLEQQAMRLGIPIEEPFTGLTFDKTLLVLGPDREYYAELMAVYDDQQRSASLLERAIQAARAVRGWISETLNQEKLEEPDPDATSPLNNTSTIVYAALEQLTLFTGDAGVPALTRALNLADSVNLPLNLRWIQLPHHGSKRNVGPSLLDRLFGVGPTETSSGRWGITSAARDGAPKHPSRRVLNAVIRRGGRVQATQGRALYFRSLDVPMRPNFSSMSSLPFTSYYED